MKIKKILSNIALILFIITLTNTVNSQWVQQTSGTSVFLNSISFTGYNTGYACGFGGLTLKTTNSGANWSAMPTITVTYLYSIYFLSDLVGFTCGTNGKIARTTDGTSWVSQVSGTTENLRGITFRGSNAGFAVGDNGTILLTTNGGTDWLPPSLDHSGNDNYYSVKETDSGKVLLIHLTDEIGIDINEADDVTIEEWVDVQSDYSEESARFINPKESDEIYSNLLNEYSLNKFNIFPNPTNSNFRVELSLKENENIHIQLVDISGKFISTIINQEFESNSTEYVDFDIKDLPSGYYNLIVNVGNKHFVRMIRKD